jgi:polyphosphate kinase
MKDGRISYSTNIDNVKVIDLSELSRVYGLSQKPIENDENLKKEYVPSHEIDKISELTMQLALSQENANSLKMLLDEKDKRIELLTYSTQKDENKVKSNTRMYVILAIIITTLAVNLAWFMPNLNIGIK